MIFTTKPASELLELLEGKESILEKALEQHRFYFERLTCLRCGAKVHPEVDTKRVPTDGAILPNYIAACNECGCTFEPYTKIEIGIRKM